MSKSRRLEALYDAIRDVPDFPKARHRLQRHHATLGGLRVVQGGCSPHDRAVQNQASHEGSGHRIKGVHFGAPAAIALGVPFVPARKAGKLPWRRHRVEYALEYGTDVIEIHEDAITPKDRVLIVDDVLATGGTAAAAIEVVTSVGGRVAGISFWSSWPSTERAHAPGPHSGRERTGVSSLVALGFSTDPPGS